MRINEVMNRANKLKTSQSEFSYLWIDSRTEYMHNFLTYGRQLTQVFFFLQIYFIFIPISLHLTQDEVEALEEDEKAVKKQYPSLSQFQEQIDFYENLHDNLKGTTKQCSKGIGEFL